MPVITDAVKKYCKKFYRQDYRTKKKQRDFIRDIYKKFKKKPKFSTIQKYLKKKEKRGRMSPGYGDERQRFLLELAEVHPYDIHEIHQIFAEKFGVYRRFSAFMSGVSRKKNGYPIPLSIRCRQTPNQRILFSDYEASCTEQLNKIGFKEVFTFTTCFGGETSVNHLDLENFLSTEKDGLERKLSLEDNFNIGILFTGCLDGEILQKLKDLLPVEIKKHWKRLCSERFKKEGKQFTAVRNGSILDLDGGAGLARAVGELFGLYGRERPKNPFFLEGISIVSSLGSTPRNARVPASHQDKQTANFISDCVEDDTVFPNSLRILISLEGPPARHFSIGTVDENGSFRQLVKTPATILGMNYYAAGARMRGPFFHQRDTAGVTLVCDLTRKKGFLGRSLP